jgi:hypothetical protein
LCGLQPPPKCRIVDVVGEGLLALDLDDGNQLAVTRLELRGAVDTDLLQLEVELVPESANLRERAPAEVAPVRVIDDDPRLRDRAHA